VNAFDRQVFPVESAPSETIMERGRRCANRSPAPRPPLALYEGSRPVDSIHAPSLSVPPASDNRALSLLDGCPECVINTELPQVVESIPSKAQRASYRCSDCGHAWITEWSL
jgi:hypothetical protein